MASLEDRSMWEDSEECLGEEVLRMATDEVIGRTRLLDNEIKIMKSEVMRISHELQAQNDKIKDNAEKIKVNKTLPYLVSNVIELLDVDPQDMGEEDGSVVDLDAQRKGKCAVIKTSTRQTYFLPVIGLVDAEKLKPGDLVGINKDSYLILETLPAEYDARVKAMEVDERPTEQYSDIGGLDKQIQELIEAVVLPKTHKERFENLGIQPPKGVLLYRPPGTGKTLLARACAAQTKSTFLKLAGPQLVQMFIGDGAKLVRDAFALAKEKAQAIIFIDELDAIGTKRFDSEKAGDREVQRTMLELLNQLDGFSSTSDIKVIAATNRVDILDPALLRSGRLDRKIEFPHPNEEARARIMQIHSRKMNISPDVNFEELSRSTDDFNGAQCKAVCVEAYRPLVVLVVNMEGDPRSLKVRDNVLKLEGHVVTSWSSKVTHVTMPSIKMTVKTAVYVKFLCWESVKTTADLSDCLALHFVAPRRLRRRLQRTFSLPTSPASSTQRRSSRTNLAKAFNQAEQPEPEVQPEQINPEPDNQLVLRKSVLEHEARIVLTKFDPSKPINPARWPMADEVSVSLRGSPVVAPASSTASTVNLNIPLQNGKVLAILPKPMGHVSHLPEMSEEFLEQLNTIEANIGIVKRLCLQQRTMPALTPRARN